MNTGNKFLFMEKEHLQRRNPLLLRKGKHLFNYAG